MEADLSNRIDSVPERFVPAEARGQLTEAEHLARYWWAGDLAAGKCVLDAGCGTGYGPNMLAARGAAEVIGVDLAEAVIDAAAAGAAPNATFRVADVHELPFEDGYFDLITCFEVIEHLDGRDRVIAELARVLDRSGVLVISSPNRDVYVPGNPHHVHEYVPDEFEAALRASFEHVELRRQHDWIGSAILDDEEARSAELEPLEGIQVGKALGAERGTETFSVALAGHSEPPQVRPVAVLTGLAEVRKWLELWHEQQTVLTGQHEHFEQLESQWEELDALRKELRRSEQELAHLPELELLPPAAQAQPGVFVDPDSPAGTEYVIPLEDARRKAAPGEERGRGDGRAGGGAQPLFGAGIKPAPGASAARTGNGGAGERGGSPRDRRHSSGKSDDAETPEALETARERGGSSVPIGATASGGSEALVTAGIAGLVLAGGLAVGFGLRRLLRTE